MGLSDVIFYSPFIPDSVVIKGSFNFFYCVEKNLSEVFAPMFTLAHFMLKLLFNHLAIKLLIVY